MKLFPQHQPVLNPKKGAPSAPGNNIPLYVFLAFSLLGFSAVAVRLFVIQVQDSDTYKLLAKQQSETRLVLHGERGNILDCNGRTIVTSVRGWSFGADPTQIKSKRDIAETFSKLFNTPASEYLNKMSDSDAHFVWLERGVDDQLAKQLESFTDPGVVRLHEPMIKYEMPIAAQLIGGTNVDDQGISGVELEYDTLLRGTDGFVVLQRDALGRKHPDEGLPQIHAQPGENIELTIDATYQEIVENELKSGVESAKAEAGTAVMLNPKTGEILAMASYAPTIGHTGESVQAAIRNRAVTDVFEPGSTFKIVMASAALEEGAVKPDEHFYAENGNYHYQDVTITDAHPLGEITFADAVAQSSNICFAKLSQRFHPEKFYKYIRDFGFGIPTGVDLPGEVRGDIPKPGEYTGVTQAFNAFGYGLSVTPLQLACAYGAIANGGTLMKPYIVKRVLGADGTCRMQEKPQVIRRVVSQETAKEMTKLFCGVVSHGTGVLAQLASMQVAGKTGTSQQLEGGKYSKHKYSASFVGYFPVEDPQIVLLVVLDAPQTEYYGGAVAAPIFKSIAERLVSTRSYHAELPQFVAHTDNASQKICVPDVRYCSVESAKQTLTACGLKLQSQGSGNMVVEQSPNAGTYVDGKVAVNISLASSDKGDHGAAAPDAVGLTVRQAVNLFASQGIPVHVVGSGRVERQVPPQTSNANNVSSATQNAAWTLYGTVE